MKKEGILTLFVNEVSFIAPLLPPFPVKKPTGFACVFLYSAAPGLLI